MADETAGVTTPETTVATPATVASVPKTVPEAATAAPAVEATPEVKPEVKPERVFKQDEVDRLIRDRLERAQRKHERETEDLRQIALRNAPKVEPVAATPDAAPKREDFQDYEDFIRAEARHVATEAVKTEREAQDKSSREQAATRERQTVEQAHVTREEAARTKYSDYDDVARNPALVITNDMADVLVLSDDGPDLAYYLGKNPAEAERIARLHPKLVAKELGRLSAKLASTTETVTLSKAPEPITPVSGGKPPAVSAEPSERDDMDTWVKKREAQIRKRQRASA